MSIHTEIGNGIPQGSALSSTLFNVIINGITQYLNKTQRKKNPTNANKISITLFCADNSALIN